MVYIWIYNIYEYRIFDICIYIYIRCFFWVYYILSNMLSLVLDFVFVFAFVFYKAALALAELSVTHTHTHANALVMHVYACYCCIRNQFFCFLFCFIYILLLLLPESLACWGVWPTHVKHNFLHIYVYRPHKSRHVFSYHKYMKIYMWIIYNICTMPELYLRFFEIYKQSDSNCLTIINVEMCSLPLPLLQPLSLLVRLPFAFAPGCAFSLWLCIYFLHICFVVCLWLWLCPCLYL